MTSPSSRLAALTPPPLDRPSAALIAADRWSLWRTFTRGLAHHLANAAQMLALDPAPPRARAEAVERIGEAQSRLSEVHRVAEGGPTLVPDVLADAQELQRLQAGFRSVDLAITADPDLPPVAIAAADLRHVLLALVTNAKQAAGAERAAIRIDAHAYGDGVEIVVEDGGPGLPPELRERAFEPYVTTGGDEALGLGLAAARLMLAQASGTIAADPGTARFRVRVPAWRRAR